MSDRRVTVDFSGLILGLLGIAFVVLKLTHVIDWSWWWVTVPFWGGIALIIGVWLIIGVIFLIASIFKALFGRKKKQATWTGKIQRRP